MVVCKLGMGTHNIVLRGSYGCLDVGFCADATMRRLRRKDRLGRGGVPSVLWSLVRRLRPSKYWSRRLHACAILQGCTRRCVNEIGSLSVRRIVLLFRGCFIHISGCSWLGVLSILGRRTAFPARGAR